jgi:biopolymer transport protein ExbB
MDNVQAVQQVAQVATQVAQAGAEAQSLGMMSFLKDHFAHVAPLLSTGVIGVAIIWERFQALFVKYPIQNQEGFFDQIQNLVLSGKTADAVALCDRYPGKPVARVVKGALLRAHLPESMIEQGLQYEVGEATQAITKRTSFLATIANVATLLGLFGTIAGLIQSFEAVGKASPQLKSTILSNGISVAMNATMLGLAVAIPCMIAYSVLMNRSNRMTAGLEHAALKTLEILKQRYYSIETQEVQAWDRGEKSSHDTSRSVA